jgi:hypothetical protein
MKRHLFLRSIVAALVIAGLAGGDRARLQAQAAPTKPTIFVLATGGTSPARPPAPSRPATRRASWASTS